MKKSITNHKSDKISKQTKMVILISTLGYFVDIYDILLFSIVRISSLKSIGITDPNAIKHYGEILINSQMIGMLIGGLAWGILGDKKGRVSILFGSIILYSVANFANAFVTNIETYTVLRFIAGFGLAGELGAGITLVSELMPKDKRGYATALVASVGILGAIAAWIVAKLTDWRTAYIVGGVMGFTLLLLRVGILESGMYTQTKLHNIKKGSFLKFFTNKERFLKYIQCILIGMPLWYMAGILVTFSNNFGEALNAQSVVLPANAVLFMYIGLSIGDLATGVLSQIWKSRRKVIFLCLFLNIITLTIYFNFHNQPVEYYYFLYFILGIINGYWALFVTVGSEQFGTNLRATATTTIPNFVRGSVPLFTLSTSYLQTCFSQNGFSVSQSTIWGAAVVGFIVLIIAIIACKNIPETYSKDLDYLEQI